MPAPRNRAETPAPAIEPGEFITAAEVAELLPGVTIQGLAQMRYRGDGPPFFKPSPRVVLYRRADIAEWIAGSRRTITG